MELALPTLMASSSGFFQSGSLLKSLIHVSNEVTSMEKLPFIQVRNISTMIRRIKLLSSLFEEIEDMNTPLPPSSVLCLTELFSVIRRVRVLIESCKDGSTLWGLIQTQVISNQFYVFVKEMGRAMDILPLSLLNITTDIREQVELLHKQAKRVELFVDPKEIQRREKLLQVMASNNEKNRKNYHHHQSFIDIETVKQVLSSIGMRSPLDYEEEISKLEAESQKQAGTGGLIVVSNINNLISLVSYSKSMIFSSNEEIDKNKEEIKQPNNVSISKLVDHSSYSHQSIPDEFRCPISLDMMKDPVIVASGHTYDRNSIAQWINTGHHTCPKSGQRLIHMALIPNYALKSLMHQWCQENNISLTECCSSSSNASELEASNSKKRASEKAIDHISATKAAMDAVKMTAEFLVGKLAMGSPDIQRQAAYELRLLAKTGMDNRRIIAEAGAIPFLVTLLNSNDARIQENAVTALLNLSIFDNNKVLIMAAGAIDNIVEVLESGKTMEARENAAAAIFSLSMIDDFKISIGDGPRAILALVGLLREGTTAGKRDAATALFNLALYSANKAKIVVSGAIPLLIELLMDDKAGITDDALGVLALLLSCSQGLEAVKKSRVLVPLLIDLLRFGSAKGKENSITLLLGLCKDGGEEVARRLLINPRSIPSLQSLSADGSLKARRKADALLRLLNRCCSQTHNPVTNF
ncbi:Armadillo [Corchorus olitorius]|uniref:RING-type E3 ubiquitin transferase n=1 Tax=Corchorus olitorius TaxID=93759 RepID=A0A1R3I0D1_9ROSI|nr:Armadillo [Corchorus olitorius]